MNGRSLAASCALAIALAGCGLKGPLYLPEKSKEVIVRPAAGDPAQPATAPEAPPSAPAGQSGEKPTPAPGDPRGIEAPPPGTPHG